MFPSTPLPANEPARGPTAADYYQLEDDKGLPLAALLVLIEETGDGAERLRRAELYTATDLEAAALDESLRQARDLLSERYSQVDQKTLSLHVMSAAAEQVVDVALPLPKAALSPPAAPTSQESAAEAEAETQTDAKKRQRQQGLTTILTLPVVGRFTARGRRLVAQREGGGWPFAFSPSAALQAGVVLVLILLVAWLFVARNPFDAAARPVISEPVISEPVISEPGVAAVGELPAPDLDAEALAIMRAETQSEPDNQPLPIVDDPDKQHAYCIWPDETLSEIAYNANVSEEAILALNPGFDGRAGATVQLPKGSTPPSQWAAPAPVFRAVTELPFGESGYYIGYNNRDKRVALSFDVGFVEGNLARMEWLAERGIHATFFVLGGAVENHPELIAQILENGHELGNHSMTHDNFKSMTADEIAWELDRTEELVQAAYPGATTKPIFRAPFGAINDQVVRIANEHGYHLIGWTIDSSDWTENISGDVLYDRVTRLMCPGAIIAMHDVNPANAEALPRIVDFLERNGYEFVTVTQMLTQGR